MLAATLADGHTVIRPAAQRARGGRSHRIPSSSMDARRRAHRPRHHRDRGAATTPGCLASGHRPIASKRARSWWPPRSLVATSRLRGAPSSHLGAFLDVPRQASAWRCSSDSDTHRRCEAQPSGSDAYHGHRTSPLLPIRAWPPTCSHRPRCLLTQARGDQHRPRIDLRGSPRVAVRPAHDGCGRSSSADAHHHATISRALARLHASTDVEMERPPRRRLADPRPPSPPKASSTISGVHHVRRGYEDIEAKVA